MADRPLAGCRILVVEDEFFIGENITEVIEAAGGNVVGPFAVIVDALEQLGRYDSIDAAVLDIGLGVESSYPLAAALKATGIPFLFLTGVKRSDLPESFSNACYLQKPFTASGLLQAIVECGVEPRP